MGPLLLGIVLLVLAFNVLMPYVLYVLCLIAGIVLVVYGVFVIFTGVTRVEPVTRRGRRYWY